MNIYKVSQDKNCDYDSYDSFVCVAESEEQAKNMFPDDHDGVIIFDTKINHWINKNERELIYGYEDIEDSSFYWKDTYWTADFDNIKVEFIGVADTKYKKPQIIVSSFNAG